MTENATLIQRKLIQMLIIGFLPVMIFMPHRTCAQTINLDSGYRSVSYRLMERLLNLYDSPEMWENTRPYDLQEVRRYIDRLRSDDSRLSPSIAGLAKSLDMYLPPEATTRAPEATFDFSSAAEMRQGSASKSLEAIYGHLDWKADNNFSAAASFEFSEALAEDPTFRGKVWHGIAGELNYAYLRYKHDFLTLTFGRDKVAWGPGRRGNLLVSSNSDGIDMFRAEAVVGPLKFTTLSAVLDPNYTNVSVGDSLVKTRINRYLSAHRLDFRPIRAISVGLSESVVYGGIGRQLEFYYTNPLTWYHGEQLNQNNDDNTLICFDLTIKPHHGVKLYGEFLIDDFQVDNASKGDDEPNELGYIAGCFLSDAPMMSNTDVSFEYTRINNRTYNQGLNWNRYIHNDKIIGHYLGPDNESIYFSARRWLPGSTWISLSYERLNAGEGSVFDQWTTPWLFSTGKYSEPFPTGTVEHRNVYGLSGEYLGSRRFRLGIDGYYFDISNAGHISGESDSFFEGKLTLTVTTGAL